MEHFYRLIASFSLVVLLAACGGGGTTPTPPPTQTPTSITTQPADQSVVASTAATFNVVATSATSYQWQSSTDGGTTFTDVVGATADSYTTPATVLPDSGKRYRVVVGGATNNVTSSSVVLTVTAGVVAPSISVPPAAQTTTTGQNASFSVIATGTNLAYQWQRSTNGGSSFADVAGATNATLALTALALADNAQQFRVMVSNSAGSVTSSAAVLTVTAAPALARIIFSRGDGTLANRDDLYAVYEDGTGLTQLTSTTDFEFFAAVAPGGRVVFQQTTGGQTDLHSVNADGTGMATVANTSDFEIFVGITPSGRVIYRRDSAITGRDLYSVNADGSGAATLANTAHNEDFAGITASGKVIFQQNTAGRTDLYSINADGTGKVALGADSVYSAIYQGATPAGLVIFRTDNGSGNGLSGIYSVSENGGAAIAVAVNTTTPYEYDLAGITASGQLIIHRTLGAGELDLYLSGGSSIVALATSTDHERFSFATPSGRIVYVRQTASTGWDTYIVNADGSATTALASSTAFEAPVHATSDKLIFASSSIFGGSNDLYSVNFNGTGTVALANAVDHEEFKGITSGGRVIYEKYVNSSPVPTVFAVNTDGTATTLLTGGFFVATTPSGKVLVRKQDNGNASLYIINSDGTGLIALANTPINEFFNAIIP